MPSHNSRDSRNALEGLQRQLDAHERAIRREQQRTTHTVQINDIAGDEVQDPTEGEVRIDWTDQRLAWYLNEKWHKAVTGGHFEVIVTDPLGDVLVVMDGLASILVPEDLDGMSVIAVAAGVTTVGGSNTVVRLVNSVTSDTILSTPITVQSGQRTSYTAATQPVINIANAIVSTGDFIRIDTTSAGSNAKGLIVVVVIDHPIPPVV